MKQASNINLSPTFTGSSDSLPFDGLLSMIELSEATGIVRATTNDGAGFEIRVDEGNAVRVTGRDGQSPTLTIAELMRTDDLDWSFRTPPKTRETAPPQGEFRTPLSQLMMGAAFEMEASR